MSSKLQQAMHGKKEVTPYEQFRAQVERLRPEIASLCGKENVDRFLRVCMNAVQSNPAVLEATRKSLLLACLKAAQDNLLPDGREAVLNVYRNKDRERSKAENRDVWVDVVQYLPMSYGLIQKIYEAGATFVDAVPVFEKDTFKYQRGDEPRIVHEPYDMGEPGPVKAAYVIVKLKTGEIKREVMWRWEIDRVRAQSKAKDGLMWEKFYDQGAVKSVIHRVVKQLPRSESLERALGHDNEATGIEDLPTPASSDLEGVVAFVEVERPKPPAQPEPAGAAASSPPATAAGGVDDKPLPKKGEAGTPEMFEKYLNAFGTLTEAEILGLKMDEARLYTWQPEQLEQLEAAYRRRSDELIASGA